MAATYKKSPLKTAQWSSFVVVHLPVKALVMVLPRAYDIFLMIYFEFYNQKINQVYLTMGLGVFSTIAPKGS